MVNRRTAIRSMLATSLIGSTGTALAHRNRSTSPGTLHPARLRSGDTIGLIAPASNAFEDEEIAFAIDVIRSLGFTVKKGKHLHARNNYLAGDDRSRAEDVNAMFADNDIDAVICLRGGYGTQRLLPYLDYQLIAENPKALVGYSDISALLNAIHTRTGLVGFHGPIARQNFTEYTLGEFKKVLVHPTDDTIIGQPPPFEPREGTAEMEHRITRFVGGQAEGKLVGGNLTLLTGLLGTLYEPDFEDCILFLEDVGEAPYRIDRMLTQLWLAEKLQQVAGIAIGKFTETDDYSGNSFSPEEVIRMRCEPLDVPTIRGLMIGHIEDQTVVPIGVRARLDADAGTLRLLEPAVR